MTLRILRCVLALATTAFACSSASAQDAGSASSSLWALHWRMIGPFRGGRAVAVGGVAGSGRIFYFGAVGGGLWKTENAGRTWSSVMDSVAVASIGAVAVAPSAPSTVYVGSGEADMRSDIIHGNGMYVSHDAGEHWQHIGLDDSRQIGRVLVHPNDPKTVLVAALGHAYAPNDERGVYRSVDGGANWTRTLFLDHDTGAIDLAADPGWHVVLASLWQTRRPPWSVYAPSNGPGSGLYRSTDAGVTWTAVRGTGIPSDGLGKIGIAIAPSYPQRAYAIVDAKAGGLYRSDDGGRSWHLSDNEHRIWQRCWYFCHVAVDPRNPDVVYVSDTSLYRSSDGGRTFTAIKGSPDGDDFHQLWIDPTLPATMVLGSDQGASVSIDGAKTWSSWFNQPTGQFYGVVTDNAFPYHLYGAQQDSGAAMILSRSDHAGIEERDWQPLTAGGESSSIAPDPRDDKAVYGGFVDREDLRSRQTRSLSPVVGMPGVWRDEWTMPLAFGADRSLYAARQMIFRSKDGGLHWKQISGDLTRRHPGSPATLDAPAAADAPSREPRGVVYALAPSPLRAGVLWAGTDDGLVYLTRDSGLHWSAVTPPGVGPWSHVDSIEASHFDSESAYVVVDRHRLDDDRPYIYVTHDGGTTWRASASGIPDGSFVHVVREDPAQRGLLYAGTETGTFVSFDAGASWESLRLNMPVVPVHGLAVHGSDLDIGTHGRAFWVLDDVEPLREIAAGRAPLSGAWAFAPQAAVRTRAPSDEAEASPPETPLGENPPSGAYLDYRVAPGAAAAVTLRVSDAAGRFVRTWSTSDAPHPEDPADVDYPAYWIEKPARLLGEPGTHRFVWNFHVPDDEGPLAPPGTYRVRMTIGASTFERTLVVRKDPRVSANDADLVAQAIFAASIDRMLRRVKGALAASAAARSKAGADVAAIDAIAGDPKEHFGGTFGDMPSSATTLRAQALLLQSLEDAAESADAKPTAAERSAWASLEPKAERSLAAWASLSRGSR